MPRKHTNESFDNVLQISNPTIRRVGEYHNLTTRTEVQCCTCDHTWLVVPKNITTGKKTSCPNCNRLSKRLDYAEFARMLQMQRGIQMITTPKNSNDVVDFKCPVDSTHVWSTSISAIKHQGQGCPFCAGNRIYTDAAIQAKLDSYGTNLILAGAYVGMNNPTTFQCRSGHEWIVTPANIIHGRARECPTCRPYVHGKGFGRTTVVDGIVFRSKLEADCYTMLSRSELPFERQKPYNIRKYTCDFYFPVTRTWVEVSSFSNLKYLERIKVKQEAVAQLGESFKFITTIDEFKRFLEIQHR